MISEEKFIEVIEFIKKQNEIQNSFCDILETMASGNYIDAFVYADYENLTVELLKLNLNLDEENDVLEYWLYDLNYGQSYYDGCFCDADSGENIDISTVEKLYAYISYINRQKMQKDDFKSYEDYLEKYYANLLDLEKQNEEE